MFHVAVVVERLPRRWTWEPTELIVRPLSLDAMILHASASSSFSLEVPL